jgi:hypothetical protein
MSFSDITEVILIQEKSAETTSFSDIGPVEFQEALLSIK